jgi:hypothetical protein
MMGSKIPSVEEIKPIAPAGAPTVNPSHPAAPSTGPAKVTKP